MTLLYPIDIDTSPGQIEFEHYCWALKNEPPAFSEWKAMEVFAENLPMIALEKVAADEDVDTFKALLGKLRRRAEAPNSLNWERAKAYPIDRLVDELGAVPRFGKIRCPAHSDTTPSLHLYAKTNTFKCFQCGKGGDPVDLLSLFTGCPNVEACKRLN